MKREQRNGWGKNAWVIGLLLTPACGGEPLGETSNLEGSDEVVARTEEAAQSVNDVPVAVFARPFIVGTGYSQFTFVIDSDRHLLRNVMYPGENPVTRGWDTVATGLVGVPTAVGYFFSDSHQGLAPARRCQKQPDHPGVLAPAVSLLSFHGVSPSAHSNTDEPERLVEKSTWRPAIRFGSLIPFAPADSQRSTKTDQDREVRVPGV